MPQDLRISMFLGIASALLAAPAGADFLPVALRVAPACVGVAHELEPRLERALDSRHLPGLAGSVDIEQARSGFRVTITIREAERARGTTTIVAPTCSEAVDAAVVVLALAFGGKRPETDVSPPPLESAEAGSRSRFETAKQPAAPQPLEPALEPPTIQLFQSARRKDRGADAEGRWSVNGRSTRIGLATGLDSGSLAHETVTLSGAIAQSFSGIDLRAIVRYGLPTADETVETGSTESSRSHFGALELRACRGTGLAVRLSACAGGELGAVSVARRRLIGGTDVDESALSPRLSGVLAALVSHRGGLIEPEIELGAAAVAAGRDPGASWLVVRAAAGAAIAF